MENLNRRIKREMNRYSAKILFPNNFTEKFIINKAQLYSNFENWIKNLKSSMHLRKYRTVIGEIESRKNSFKAIEELHWKYQFIEIDAIFKILKKKFYNHKKEISNEGSHQYHSCLFWFNQIFLILEQFLLETRFDLNKKINNKNTNIMKPIQCAIDYFIKFCFVLLLFSQYNQQIPDILSYISIIERIIPFMKFTSKSSSYIYVQKIQLFKVKILTENCDYLNALNSLESNIDFCFDYIKLLSDDKFNVYIFDSSNEKNRKYLENLKKKRLLKIYQYKGFIKQNDEDNSNVKNEMKINNKKSLISLNKQKLKNIEILKNINKQSPKKYMNKNRMTNLELKKNISCNSVLSNKTNSTSNYRTMKQSESQSTIATQKVKNIKNKKSSNKTVIINENKKNHLILKKVISIKRMEKDKKKIIEEILNIMALNFYFRGVIFEHVGNIDSALDSYKEVEWFSIKFLSNKFPSFVKCISSLLNCAWSNYNIIYNIKYEKVKMKKKKEILKEIELIKKKEKIKAQERSNRIIFNYKSNHLFNNKKLNNYLTSLGKKIYKEEEQRNFNIYNKFTKNDYILSTYKMVDDLLSDEFRPILKTMKKVEVTKPDEEIQDLIDKALIKRKHQYSIQENDLIFNNLIHSVSNNNNNIDNSKTSSKINKESNNNNNSKTKNKILKPFKFNGYFRKKVFKNNSNLISHLKEKSPPKVSTSCEMTNNQTKNSFLIYSYKENNINKRHYNNLLNMTKIENKKEKVKKYFVDKDNFSKSIMEKKIFLDNYSKKEFNFLNDLLKTKSFLEEIVNPIDDLELKKVKHDADINFNVKLEMAKSGKGKKNLKNLIRQNINIIENSKNKKYIQNNSETPSEQSENNIIDNNSKLKQIENEYNDIILKRNKLIEIKKRAIYTSKSSYI